MDRANLKSSGQEQTMKKTRVIDEAHMINTPLGILPVRHGVDKNSRRKESVVKFYKNGNVRSVPLNEPTDIDSPLGPITAELVTFYESGRLRRIFPLDGQLSGYWSEANEYQLAQSLSLKTPVGYIFAKSIYIEFYESGALKSLLFWPKERVVISTPAGELMVRKGISFYESGTLKNIEPCEPVAITTPIGSIEAFQPDPQGMMAESSGICFDKTGEVLSVYSITKEIHVFQEPGLEKVFTPRQVPSYCDESSFFLEPLQICFEKDMVVFKSGNTYLDMVPLNARFKLKEFSPTRPLGEVLCQS